jgi:hypothetical protein
MTWLLPRLRPVFRLLSAAWIVLLPASAKPALEGFSFRQFEGGPAWTPEYQPRAGDRVCFEFRIAGLSAKEGDFDDEIQYTVRLEALDGRGRAWADPAERKNIATVTPEDKKNSWKPKEQGCLALPELLAATDFRVRVTVEDLLSGETAREEFPFRVDGPAIEPGAPFSVHSLRFLREEDSPEPLTVAAYRAGDTVWIRFEMIGFGLTETGEADIAYGVRVVNSAGKTMYENLEAVEEKRKFRYPPAFLPGVSSISVQSKTPAGTYQVTIFARDRVTGQQAEAVGIFRLE